MGEPDRLTPAAPVSVLEATSGVVAQQLRELKRHYKPARKGEDPEAVHQMRVATRRLRAALRALGSHVRPPGRLRADLRWLARRLGAVRDHDVILALLRSQRLPAALTEERAQFARLVGKLERRRQGELERLARALRRKRYRRLLEDLAAFAERPRAIGVGEAMAARVLAEVSARLGEEVAQSTGMIEASPAPEALHVLRISFKRLRYALEFHAATCGFSYDVERQMARRMQDVLGEIHDRDLLLGWLAEGKGPFRGPWPALEKRLITERARLFRRFLRFRREWRSRTRPEPLVAPIEPPRFVNLEPQPVTLRLVTGGRSVASTEVR